MANTRAAYRYALALLGVAEEAKQLELVARDLAELDSLLHRSRELVLFLKSPIVKRDKKKNVLNELFKDRLCKLTFLFLDLMARKGREELLPEIIQQFNKLHDKRSGILKADLRVAFPMADDQQKALIEQLNKRTGKDVRLTIKQDPSLIGGFTVQYDDTVLDGSVRHQLEMLEQRFIMGSV